MGNLPPIQYQKQYKDLRQVPKMRKTETERVKRKANTPKHNQSKRHQGYKSPDHAFNDEEDITYETSSIEDEIIAAEAQQT